VRSSSRSTRAGPSAMTSRHCPAARVRSPMRSRARPDQ
jgi:hypothetical protein